MNFSDVYEELVKDWENTDPITMGMWTFYKDKLTIEDDSGYVVPLEEIVSTGEFLDWILQIHSKDGFEFENFVNLLIYAAEWNFHGNIQGVFCPSGLNREDIRWRD